MLKEVAMTDKKDEEIKFEKAISELEQIVNELEEGNLPLDESLEAFQNGIVLSKICNKQLTEAERKIELLTKDKDGNLNLQPVEIEEN